VKEDLIIPHVSAHYSTVPYSTVQYSTVKSSTVPYSMVQYSPVQCSEVRCSTLQYSPVQYSTVQCSTVQYCLESKVQHRSRHAMVLQYLKGADESWHWGGCLWHCQTGCMMIATASACVSVSACASLSCLAQQYTFSELIINKARGKSGPVSWLTSLMT